MTFGHNKKRIQALVNMSSDKERETPKLNMGHGFMQSIIKNQVDRDDYDKEQKLLKVQSKISGANRKERPKRASIQMYVPPHLRAKTTSEEKDSSPKSRFVSLLGLLCDNFWVGVLEYENVCWKMN